MTVNAHIFFLPNQMNRLYIFWQDKVLLTKGKERRSMNIWNSWKKRNIERKPTTITQIIPQIKRGIYMHSMKGIMISITILLQKRFRCCQFFRGSSLLSWWIPQKNSATFTRTSSKRSLLLCCDDKEAMKVMTQKNLKN